MVESCRTLKAPCAIICAVPIWAHTCARHIRLRSIFSTSCHCRIRPWRQSELLVETRSRPAPGPCVPSQAFRIATVLVVAQPRFLRMSELKPPGKRKNVLRLGDCHGKAAPSKPSIWLMPVFRGYRTWIAYIFRVKKRNARVRIKHALLPCWCKICNPILFWRYPSTMPEPASMVAAIRLIGCRNEYRHTFLQSREPTK